MSATSRRDALGVQVFSVTRVREREVLGETITEWIRAHPENQIEHQVVRQSSDADFHCLTIVVFYRYPVG
jgi:hypothetical protein